MKHLLLFCLLNLMTLLTFSQNQKKIQKAWIKTTTENLSNIEIDRDTLYTRYTFDKSLVFISFYPGWDDHKMEWATQENSIRIGFDTYRIEELTDTSLTIALDGFRRFRFLSERHLSDQEKNLVPLGEFNQKPLYKANEYITPRYAKNTSLRDVVQKNLEGYNIKKAAYFLATFIVTEDGKVENVQIVNGITEGFNNEVIKQLLKTSKHWKPAYFRGKPIQTQMSYQIKYLNSLTNFNSGDLN